MSILAAFMVPHPPMIVPAVGRGGEEQIRETTAAYEQVAEEIARLQPETIIITSPHSIMYADYFHISPGKGAEGSFSEFGAPQVSFDETYDEELVNAICGLADRNGFPAGTLGERNKRLDHGTMVPLWFVRQAYNRRQEAAGNDFRLVRIGLSGLPLTDHYRFGQLLRKAVHDTGRRAVLIASGDLSHKLQDYGPYGFAPEGPQYDERIMDVCGRAAFGELLEFEDDFCEKAAECGHRSFVIMAGAFDGQAVTAQKLAHQDVTGVGYGICTFYPGEADDSRRFLDQYMEKAQQAYLRRRGEEDPYVQLARRALESYVLRREVIKPDNATPASTASANTASASTASTDVATDQPGDAESAKAGALPEELLTSRAGAFVSVHEGGALRGCIGTIGPTRATLAEEIIGNAISAATQDPRFSPIRPEELPMLEISVDVLGEPEDIDSEEELDVKRYGVIVTNGGRRGLLLPDLEGVDTVRQQVQIAKQKAGIQPHENVQLQRFEVIRHE